MANNEEESPILSPSQQALSKLIALIEEDSTLEECKKSAILADLGSENPILLEKLRETIGTEEQSDEA